LWKVKTSRTLNFVHFQGAMMSICFKEGLKLEQGALEEIIGGTGNDVRQTLTHLSMYAADKGVKVGTAKAKDEAHSAKKDVKLVSRGLSWILKLSALKQSTFRAPGR
jgi:DNA polymerase III delta prime subunit